jgi:NAD(P)H-hydrate epimerase
MKSMKILTAAEMQACDRATTGHYGIPSIDLMRAASAAAAEFVRSYFSRARRITVLCGRGNNGGDGLMTARLLLEAGLHVTALLLGEPDDLRGDAATAWRELAGRFPLVALAVLSADRFADYDAILNADLILDAIVGTGFKPPLRDLPLAALEWLKASKAPIFSVDLPSGWDADTDKAEPTGPVFPSDAIVTFTAPKPAHLFGQLTRRITDPIVVAPIGSPDEAVVSSLNLHWAGSAKSITELDRPFDSNKGMFGHVLVVGGSVGKSGAPGMASLAALRSGAGLVTAAVAPPVLPLVAALAPELMTHALAITDAGELSTGNLDAGKLKTLLHRITVLAVGPGLGTTPEAVEFALGLLEATANQGTDDGQRLPAVVDADALNAISLHPERLDKIAEGRTLVLTPHPGEMARLTGLTIKQVQSDRIRIARDFATKHQLILVLKGWRTLIAHPDGSVAVNTTGNPAMAKGGSGDLLTGMVAGLLAQHPHDPQRAVEAAVYLHGLAADITVRQSGIGGDQHTLLATDSLANLSRAFRFHAQGDSGYCWLQGQPRKRYPERTRT